MAIESQTPGVAVGKSDSPTASDVTCVYVAGSGRNGSTALGLCLAGRPEVFFAGELTHIWQRGYLNNQLCGCGAPFRECEFWQAVTESAFGSLSESEVRRIEQMRNQISTFARVPRLLMGKTVDSGLRSEYCQIYSKLLRAIASVSGTSQIIDSSKYPTDLDVILQSELESVKVLHLVRNCNAVVYSWKKRKKRPEIHWKDQDMPRYSTIKTAVAWRLFNSLTTRLSRDIGERYRLIRYESFFSDYSRSIEDVFAWLGLCEAPAERADFNPHNVSGNPCRFDFDPSKIVIDQEWKEKISRRDRAIVRLVCGRMQRSLGYESE